MQSGLCLDPALWPYFAAAPVEKFPHTASTDNESIDCCPFDLVWTHTNLKTRTSICCGVKSIIPNFYPLLVAGMSRDCGSQCSRDPLPPPSSPSSTSCSSVSWEHWKTTTGSGAETAQIGWTGLLLGCEDVQYEIIVPRFNHPTPSRPANFIQGSKMGISLAATPLPMEWRK